MASRPPRWLFSTRFFLLFLLSFDVLCPCSGKEKKERRQEQTKPKWWHTWRQRILFRLRPDDDEPGPVVVQDFLTADEAVQLLERYTPLLRESLHDKGTIGATSISQSQYRTSQSVRLPPRGDDLVFDIEQRAAQLAAVPHWLVEDFQLSCYDEDALYGLHRDDADGPKRANRAATVLIYLQAPTEGGATLFTRRAIEEERDPHTGGPLKTEAAALALFRRYCQTPPHRAVVVDAVVGRAVVWPNWYNTTTKHNGELFCRKSTHGACPVRGGRKCVIQQWMTKGTPTPLRDPRVAALFPAGADASFGLRNTTTTTREENAPTCCLRDASTQRGNFVSQLCLQGHDDDDTVSFLQPLDVSQGPYTGIGGMRLMGGGVGLSGTMMIPSLQGGFTICFWVRNLQALSTLVRVGDDWLSVQVISTDDDGTLALELMHPGDPHESSARIVLTNHQHQQQQWLWVTLSVDLHQKKARLCVFPRDGREALGTATLSLGDNESCSSLSEHNTEMSLSLLEPLVSLPDTNSSHNHNVKNTAFIVQQQPPPEHVAFVASSSSDKLATTTAPYTAEISLIVIHKAVLDPQEAAKLRKETLRYDITK